MSNTDELTRLAELHRNGDLTDEEFAAAKKNVIESTDEKRDDFFREETPRPNQVQVAPQVIVKAKEGCFLQTLNVGCMIIAGFIVLVILIMIFSHH